MQTCQHGSPSVLLWWCFLSNETHGRGSARLHSCCLYCFCDPSKDATWISPVWPDGVWYRCFYCLTRSYLHLSPLRCSRPCLRCRCTISTRISYWGFLILSQTYPSSSIHMCRFISYRCASVDTYLMPYVLFLIPFPIALWFPDCYHSSQHCIFQWFSEYHPLIFSVKSPRKLLEMQILRSHPRHTNPETLKNDAQCSVFQEAFQVVLIAADIWEPLKYSIIYSTYPRGKSREHSSVVSVGIPDSSVLQI